MKIWDRGTYEAKKVSEEEILVTFHGGRLDGRYAIFQTREDNWLVHRMV